MPEFTRYTYAFTNLGNATGRHPPDRTPVLVALTVPVSIKSQLCQVTLPVGSKLE